MCGGKTGASPVQAAQHLAVVLKQNGTAFAVPLILYKTHIFRNA
jgi:hypothetical protein